MSKDRRRLCNSPRQRWPRLLLTPCPDRLCSMIDWSHQRKVEERPLRSSHVYLFECTLALEEKWRKYVKYQSTITQKKKKRLSVWPCPPPSTAGIGSSSPRPWIKYKLVKDGWVANVHTIALNSINRSLIAPQYHLQGWKVSYVLALYTLLLSIMYNILYIIYYI